MLFISFNETRNTTRSRYFKHFSEKGVTSGSLNLTIMHMRIRFELKDFDMLFFLSKSKYDTDTILT